MDFPFRGEDFYIVSSQPAMAIPKNSCPICFMNDSSSPIESNAAPMPRFADTGSGPMGGRGKVGGLERSRLGVLCKTSSKAQTKT